MDARRGAGRSGRNPAPRAGADDAPRDGRDTSLSFDISGSDDSAGSDSGASGDDGSAPRGELSSIRFAEGRARGEEGSSSSLGGD
jgi:hypothetical protein